ncbi:hypothetical protein [Haloarchaeobius sp. HRN-SO-5]
MHPRYSLADALGRGVGELGATVAILVGWFLRGVAWVAEGVTVTGNG